MKSVNKNLTLSLAAVILTLATAPVMATCSNCATGSETYPASWANHRSAQVTNVAIPYATLASEYGADWSNSNVSGTWRPDSGNQLPGVNRPTAFNSVRLANLCNSAFLASSDVSLGLRDSRGVYFCPTLVPNASAVMKDNTGTDLTHSNLRFSVFANSINDGSPIHDVDMTGVSLLGVNTFFGSFWNHVNLSSDPVSGRGIKFVQHTDGSLIVATVPADKQPIISDAWVYTWSPTSRTPIGKATVVKVIGKVGYTLVRTAITANDTALNPAISAGVPQVSGISAP